MRLGIKFNTRWYFCTECLLDFCDTCHDFHDYHVASRIRMITVDLLRDKSQMPPQSDCAICLRALASGLECQDCKLCLCNICYGVPGRLKAWAADHSPPSQAHRSFILKAIPFYKVPPQTTEPCPCSNMRDVFHHCSACSTRQSF
jgi:hypothetical protein